MRKKSTRKLRRLESLESRQLLTADVILGSAGDTLEPIGDVNQDGFGDVALISDEGDRVDIIHGVNDEANFSLEPGTSSLELNSAFYTVGFRHTVDFGTFHDGTFRTQGDPDVIRWKQGFIVASDSNITINRFNADVLRAEQGIFNANEIDVSADWDKSSGVWLATVELPFSNYYSNDWSQSQDTITIQFRYDSDAANQGVRSIQMRPVTERITMTRLTDGAGYVAGQDWYLDFPTENFMGATNIPELLAGDVGQAINTPIDHQVTFADALKVYDNLGMTDAAWRDGDFNGNGVVDLHDWNVTLSRYQGATEFPEPPEDIPMPSNEVFVDVFRNIHGQVNVTSIVDGEVTNAVIEYVDFEYQVEEVAAKSPRGVLLFDFNGDGIRDSITNNEITFGSIEGADYEFYESVDRAYSHDGAFREQRARVIDFGSAGDVNGDGSADFFMMTNSDDEYRLSVIYGFSDPHALGPRAQKINLPSGLGAVNPGLPVYLNYGSSIAFWDDMPPQDAVAVGDVNGDGKDDIQVVFNNVQVTGLLTVTDAGEYWRNGTLELDEVQVPEGVDHFFDFNGDGYEDSLTMLNNGVRVTHGDEPVEADVADDIQVMEVDGRLFLFAAAPTAFTGVELKSNVEIVPSGVSELPVLVSQTETTYVASPLLGDQVLVHGHLDLGLAVSGSPLSVFGSTYGDGNFSPVELTVVSPVGPAVTVSAGPSIYAPNSEVVLDFSESLTLNHDDVSAVILANGVPLSVSVEIAEDGSHAVIDLSGIESGNHELVLTQNLSTADGRVLDGDSDGDHGGGFAMPFSVALPGDTDLDGEVTFADFLKFSSNFGATDAAFADGDFDGDGEVGFTDFLLLSQNFGHSL